MFNKQRNEVLEFVLLRPQLNEVRLTRGGGVELEGRSLSLNEAGEQIDDVVARVRKSFEKSPIVFKHGPTFAVGYFLPDESFIGLFARLSGNFDVMSFS